MNQLFNSRDTTLSSFSNCNNITLIPFPSITLSYSSSKVWLWMFICLKDMHVWMHGNFEFLWMHVWMYENFSWTNGNFEFLFLSECMFKWMETLSFSFWMMNETLSLWWMERCMKLWILFLNDEWNFEFMMNGKMHETLRFSQWMMNETLSF